MRGKGKDSGRSREEGRCRGNKGMRTNGGGG